MSHSICVILTENVREKEVPAVTTVSTTGLLLERPMSTYTAHTSRYTTVPVLQGGNYLHLPPAWYKATQQYYREN